MMSQFSCDIVMIGRSPSNQIVIDHPTVSAHHAVLLRTGASYSLKDLNSTKGTQINGDFVTDAELNEGDTIRFGSVTAVFQKSIENGVQAAPNWKVLAEYFELGGVPGTSSPWSAETANSCAILSSSRNAASFSSDRTTNLLPVSRCESTIQIVRPSRSTVARQPQLQPIRSVFRDARPP